MLNIPNTAQEEQENPTIETWKHISEILPIVIQRIVDKMEEK